MDALTLTLAAAAAVLLAVAGVALGLARAARGDLGSLREELAALRREAEGARVEAQVARAEGDGHARRVGERDERLGQLAAEVAAWGARHREAEARCADAEARCASATEGGKRLEALVAQLREDHARATQGLREDHERILAGVREEAAGVRSRLRQVEEEFSRLGASHAALERERSERDASHEREVARLRELREEMTREFQALAAATLRDTGAQFSTSHQERLTELLTPFREQVGRFEAELRQVHQTADKDRALLTEQIRALTDQTRSVSEDAANLARALKGDKQRQGAWGEAQLERYLELMGFRRDVDYVVQSSRVGDEGDRLRPDVILNLPGGKALVIDSKVSLSAYASAVEAETEEERETFLKLHARNVRARVDELAARDYHRAVDGSMDWVLLFMPVEGAVSAAWSYDGEIATYAMERGVALAYPTTLLMSLKTVKHLWDVEKRNKNAEAIAERAGRLYDKLSGFIENFEMVGRALDSAAKAHERARGQLVKGPGNLVRQVEQLKDLGARTGKTMGLAADEGEEEAPRLPAPGEGDGPAATVLPAAE